MPQRLSWRSRVRRRGAALCLASAVVSLTLISAGAQGIPKAPEPQKIVIRILDAHSGKPINKEPLGVWLEKGITFRKSPIVAPMFVTNIDGDATISYHPTAGVDDLSLWVGRDIPCEPYNKIDGDLDFPIQKILTSGIVSDNVCGKARHVPVPGVLIVFVRHHPWWTIGELLAPASTFSGT